MEKNEERLLFLNRVMDLHKKRMGERLRQSRKLFDGDIVIGDIHSHSFYSDGACEVAELKGYADMADMDFIFVTDHDTLAHKDDCSDFENVWVGQECACAGHHIGLLSPTSVFVPNKSGFVESWRDSQENAPFTWIAHPTGWPDNMHYPDDAINLIFDIGDSLAIEVLNGYGKISGVFDQWQAKSVQLWNKLLLSGKKVTAVGGGDAHFAAGVGCVWTGVFVAECTCESVIKALAAGRTIASEAPILLLTTGEIYPGGTVKTKTNENINFKLRAADSLGLSEVRLIRDGEIVKSFNVNGQQFFKEDLVDKVVSGNSYYRLECVSIDYKHAFTSPIYFEGN